MNRRGAVALSLGACLPLTAACSYVELRRAADAGATHYVLRDAACGRIGAAVVCRIDADRHEGFPFPAADATTYVDILLRFRDWPNSLAAVPRPIEGYVIQGGVEPSEDDIFTVVDSSLSSEGKLTPVRMEGSLRRRPYSRVPDAPPGAFATIDIRRARLVWRSGVAAGMHEPFLVTRIPHLASWPYGEGTPRE